MGETERSEGGVMGKGAGAFASYPAFVPILTGPVYLMVQVLTSRSQVVVSLKLTTAGELIIFYFDKTSGKPKI
jgi:hypothetical protein